MVSESILDIKKSLERELWIARKDYENSKERLEEASRAVEKINHDINMLRIIEEKETGSR